jgi:O-antigen ligase
VGVAVVADHPLWGTGQDTYALVFPDYRDETLEPEVATHFAAFRPESPHNVYVGIAAGSGIPALPAYLGIVAGSVWALLRSIPTGGRVGTLASAMLAALGGHLVTDFFMTMDLSGSWLTWAIMGAAVTIADRVARRDASPLPPSQTRA